MAKTVIKSFSSGVLLRTAIQAFERIEETDDKIETTHNDVLVVILFAASAIEAFINEFGEIALTFHSPKNEDKIINQLVNVLKELEKAKESTRLKYQFVKFILSNQTYDKGKPPYEDLNLLFRLRNNIVHSKPTEITDKPEKITNTLIAKKLLKENNSNLIISWLSRISKRSVAKWAINSTIDIIRDLQKSVIDSTIKNNDAKIILSQHFTKIDKVK